MNNSISHVLIIVIAGIITTAAVVGLFISSSSSSEPRAYYFSVNPEQNETDLVISGESNLPDNSELEIKVPEYGISRKATITENQYRLTIQKSPNDSSEDFEVNVSFSPKKQPEHVKNQVGEKGKLMKGSLVDNSSTPWTLKNKEEFSWQRVNSPPNPDFTYTIDNRTVHFEDNSIDIDGEIASWEWDFGPYGKKSENKRPVFTYGDIGVYEVELTVIDDDGAEKELTKNVTIEKNLHFSWDYSHPITGESGSFEQKVVISDELDRYEWLSHSVHVYLDNEYSVEENIRRLITPEDSIIENLAKGLREDYLSIYSPDNEVLPDFVLEFVQEALPYSKDVYDNVYYWPYPIEVLEKGKGACSEKSILYASLMQALGYEACVADFPYEDHMVGGIVSQDGESIPGISSSAGYVNVTNVPLSENGVNYWPAETTGEEWKLGQSVTDLGLQYNVIPAEE